MPRNLCIRHPKKEVIEVPAGWMYCKRCRHVFPPEEKFVELSELEVVAVEAEPEVIREAQGSKLPDMELEAESSVVVEIPEETPVEAIKKDMERRALETPVEADNVGEGVLEVVEAKTVEEMKAEVEKIIEESNIPEEVKKDIVIEIVKEEVKEPLQEEPQEETVAEEVAEPIEEEAVVPEPEVVAEAVKEPVEVFTKEYLEGLEKAKKAKIALLKAQLAELE